jgi:hypothetical protein
LPHIDHTIGWPQSSSRAPHLRLSARTRRINPVLDIVDTVVYLAAGQARTGSVDKVLTSSVLSELPNY